MRLHQLWRMHCDSVDSSLVFSTENVSLLTGARISFLCYRFLISLTVFGLFCYHCVSCPGSVATLWSCKTMVSVPQANLISCLIGFVLSCFHKSNFSCSLLWLERYSRSFYWALEPHDYRIYFLNIDLRHQHGISVVESQTFHLTKHVPCSEERGETDVFAGYVLIWNACGNVLLG